VWEHRSGRRVGTREAQSSQARASGSAVNRERGAKRGFARERERARGLTRCAGRCGPGRVQSRAGPLGYATRLDRGADESGVACGNTDQDGASRTAPNASRVPRAKEQDLARRARARAPTAHVLLPLRVPSVSVAEFVESSRLAFAAASNLIWRVRKSQTSDILTCRPENRPAPHEH